MEQREKKGLRMPTAYSILLLLILLVALLTHLIAGVRGASLAEVVMAIPEGFLDPIDVCLFILILGGRMMIRMLQKDEEEKQKRIKKHDGKSGRKLKLSA